MNLSFLPNLITLFRACLVIPVLYALSIDAYKLAFFLFLLAGISDAVDGFLARRLGQLSRFGSIVDPLADKWLMISTFLMLAYAGLIPSWLVLAIIARDIIVILGAIGYHFFIGTYAFAPSKISKLNTFLQIALIVMILFQQSYGLIPSSLNKEMMTAVFLLNLASLLQYVWVWSQRAIRANA